jgi:S-formylglutathione hydrolase FrmB
MSVIFRRRRSFWPIFPVIAILIVFLPLARRKPAQTAVVDRPRLAPGIVMQDVTFYSQAVRRNMQYRVFLPERSQTRLTVVYLLHGGGGTFRDWSNYSDVAQFAGSDFLLVMPQGDYSYYSNAAERPQDRYEDYIVNDLSADVESRFSARQDRAGRAIIGVSMEASARSLSRFGIPIAMPLPRR